MISTASIYIHLCQNASCPEWFDLPTSPVSVDNVSRDALSKVPARRLNVESP